MATDRRANNPAATNINRLWKCRYQLCAGVLAENARGRSQLDTYRYGCKPAPVRRGGLFSFPGDLRTGTSNRNMLGVSHQSCRDCFEISSSVPSATLQTGDTVTWAAELMCPPGAAMSVRTHPSGANKDLAGSLAARTFHRARLQGLVLRNTAFPFENLDHLKTPRPKHG